jgi:hypothetical protein
VVCPFQAYLQDSVYPDLYTLKKTNILQCWLHVKIHERDKCQVGGMWVVVSLDGFAQVLAAWHTKIDPHKLPESAHPRVPC